VTCLRAFEDPRATTIWDAFHRQPPAPCAGRTHSRKRSREGFRCDEGASVSSPTAAYSRTLELRARRPSLNASISGDMEVRPLLCAGHCLSTSATTSTTREHDLERPILARLGVRALAKMSPCRCVGPRFPCASFDARGMRQPSLFQGKAGGEPDSHHRCRLSDSTSPPTGGAPKVTAPRDVACEATPRVHRRLHRGWVRQ